MSTGGNKKIRILAGGGLLCTALIWGFSFVVIKDSLDLIPPSYILAFRFTLASLVLGCLFHKKLRALNKQIIKQGAFLGLLLFLSYLFQTIGLDYTTAGKNAFLTTIYVVLVPFLHWIINRKKPNKYCIIAAFLAIWGIGLLSLQGDFTINIGDALTLVSGFGYALHMIYIDKYTKVCSAVLLTILQLFFGGVFSWLTAPILDGGFPTAVFQPNMIAGMLYLGLFCTMVAFLLQNVCQKYTSPSATSLLLSLESVFGAIFSAIFLAERMTLRMYTGCLLLFAGVILAETRLQFLPFMKKE